MSAQHTLGPWVAEVFDSLDDAKTISGFEWTSNWRWDSSPAAVWRQEGGGVIGLPGCIETTAANAHLIAAAPDLLEALEAPLKRAVCGELLTLTESEIDAARAAIAKAKGGNQ